MDVGAECDASPAGVARLGAMLRSRAPAHAETQVEAPDELDAILLEILRAARLACPTFTLPPDVFVAYLGDRIPPEVPAALALRQMHTSDLYLACACGRGDARALAMFDDRCLSHLDRVLARIGVNPDVSADVKQDIRTRVLVGEGQVPGIGEFSGRGDLRGWVRVMAVRQALRRQTRVRREVSVEDDELLERLVVVPDDPAIARAKAHYRQAFKRAFDGALRALPAREGTLLRQHYVDGLTIDELGKLYRVHRSTAARLLVRARLLVLEATRGHMMAQLDLQTADLDSIMRTIGSQLEISLRGLRIRRKH